MRPIPSRDAGGQTEQCWQAFSSSQKGQVFHSLSTTTRSFAVKCPHAAGDQDLPEDKLVAGYGEFAAQKKIMEQKVSLPYNSWKIATLILSLLVLIFASLAAFSLSGLVLKHAVSSGGGNATPQGQRTSFVTSLTATPTLQPISPLQPSTTLVNGVLTENRLLTCNGCDDPIHIVISTIQVDSVHGYMTWNNMVQSIAGSGMSYALVEYDLQANTSQIPVAALLSQKASSAIQAFFAFAPLHTVTYTLSVVMNVYREVRGAIPINPTSTITFDPVDVTF